MGGEAQCRPDNYQTSFVYTHTTKTVYLKINTFAKLRIQGILYLITSENASIICKHFTFLQQKKYIQNNSDNLTY